METESPALPRPKASWWQEASEAWSRQDYQQTIDLLNRASREQPGDWRLLLNLGEAYGRRFEYREAETRLEKAVQVSESKGEVLAEAGRRCERFGQPGMANSFFKRSLQNGNVNPSVLVALAEFEEGHSRPTAALVLLDRALHVQPTYAGALVARARMHRGAGELEQGERLLRKLLAKAGGEVSAPAWYELGTILDRQGRYDQAMEAFLQAKALLRPASAPHLVELERIRAETREMAEGLTASTLKR
jgi:tetratricopeptide (TPR) repeat protein